MSFRRAFAELLPRCWTVSLAIAVAAPQAAGQDSWGFDGLQRAVDPSGRWYVVAANPGIAGSSGRFALIERAADAPPIGAARDAAFRGPAEAGIRAGDRVVAEGRLESAPRRLHVLSEGRGFVAVDCLAAHGRGKALVAIGLDGSERLALTRCELFPALKARFHCSRLHWLAASWLDEEAGEVLLAATDGSSRAIDLQSGRVRHAGSRDLVRAMLSRSEEARESALSFVRPKTQPGLRTFPGERPEHLRVVLPALARIVQEAGPIGLRVRAAAALCELGDERGRELVLAAERGALAELAEEELAVAVGALPSLLGEEALPLLFARLRGAAGPVREAAGAALAWLGRPASAELLEIVRSTRAAPELRASAARALERMFRSNVAFDVLSSVRPASLAPLLEVALDPSEEVASAALDAAMQAAEGDRALTRRLAELLRRGGTQDERIARTLAHLPAHPELPLALESARSRQPVGSAAEAALDAALALARRRLAE